MEKYIRDEVALILNIDIAEVNALILSGKLKAIAIGSETYITENDLLSFLRSYSSNRLTDPEQAPGVLSRRTYSRRDILMGGLAIANLIVTIVNRPLWDRYQEVREMDKAHEEDDAEAMSLFKDLVRIRSGNCSYSVGKRYKTKLGYHPDNCAAGIAFLKPLGLAETNPLCSSSPLDTTMNPDGDVILVGGPVGTILSKIAFEFEGSDDRHLKRSATPIIPLRWYGIANQDDDTVRESGLISYNLEEVGRIVTANWHLVDTKKKITIETLQGKRLGDTHTPAYLPQDNYLTITKIPNFLSPRFGTLLDEKIPDASWPHLYVFDGRNGIGTRAAELLVTRHGLAALRAALASGRFNPTDKAFQITFRTKDLVETEGGFHRFSNIEFWDADTIYLKPEKLRKAFDYAQKRLRPLMRKNAVIT